MWDQMSEELRAENQEIFIAYHDRVAGKEFGTRTKWIRSSATGGRRPTRHRRCATVSTTPS